MPKTISTYQNAHIVAQIRAKQLATIDSQDKLKQELIKTLEEKQDISGDNLLKQIDSNVNSFYNISLFLSGYLKNEDVGNIGYPIQFNKTTLQLEMVKKWVLEQSDALVSQIAKGLFYHKLPNNISPDTLPVLQSPSTTEYWGNENSSVSSVLLYSVATTLGIKPPSMPGAATYYQFYNPKYTLNKDKLNMGLELSYPFADQTGMMLFGDYQYGAHRYFKDQFVFAPEDCSTAVSKATDLTDDQIKAINTNDMINSYSNSNNQYGYRGIACFTKEGSNKFELIQLGDVLVIKGHTAIITDIDNSGNIETLQFSRDLESLEKKLGGGIYNYNLTELVERTDTYILRHSSKILHESCNLNDILERIDTTYYKMCPDGQITNVIGDCSIFL